MKSSAGRPWFLLTLALSCVTIVAFVFSLWEVIENAYFRDVDYVGLHRLYITRGVMSSLVIGAWASWFVLRERRRHEEDLEQSCEHYRTILNHMPEAVVLFDEQFQVAEWNESAERLYGLNREDVVGETLPTVGADQWDEMKEVLTLLSRDQRVLDKETERRSGAGERVPIAASFSSIPATGNRPRLFAEVAQDIRPRLLYRDKLLQVEKLTLMGQIAAGTAHHLNTPLTSMLLQVELLRQQSKTNESVEELTALERPIRFCQVFVQNLLRFGRRPQMPQGPTDLCDAIQAAASLFRPSLSLKQATIELRLEEILHCRIFGDPSSLEVMFSALVSNAVDAIPTGGRIDVQGHFTQSRHVEITIEDNGPGVPEGQWPRICEPFYTSKPAGHGTGLGLPIARSIVEQHRGALLFESRKEGGFRVKVKFPLLSDEPA